MPGKTELDMVFSPAPHRSREEPAPLLRGADSSLPCSTADLINGARLIKALNQSFKHVRLPQTYKTMYQQCAEIVRPNRQPELQHVWRSRGEPRGQFVANRRI